MGNKTYRIPDGWHSWGDVEDMVLSHPAHTDLLVHSDMVPDIPDEYRQMRADYDGQMEDYGCVLDDNRGIHVKVYDGYYKIHWDKKSQLADPLGHLYHDAPHWLAIGGIVAAGITSAYLVYREYKKSKNQAA